MSVPLGKMEALGKADIRTSVEVADSCNCTQCCPRNCCFPWGRKIVKHEHPTDSSGHIDITATGIRVVSASEPSLTASGQWEMDIQGSQSTPNMTIVHNPVGDSIKTEHGVPK